MSEPIQPQSPRPMGQPVNVVEASRAQFHWSSIAAALNAVAFSVIPLMTPLAANQQAIVSIFPQVKWLPSAITIALAILGYLAKLQQTRAAKASVQAVNLSPPFDTPSPITGPMVTGIVSPPQQSPEPAAGELKP